MSNAELILQLVEMLLEEKEKTMKAKEEKKAVVENTQPKAGQRLQSILLLLYKKSMCSYRYTYKQQ